MDDSKLHMLGQFIELGWALIPLHDVAREGGACSCGAGAQCRSAGKHPRNSAWQAGGWVRDVATLELCLRGNDGWNWGAVTGTPSGVWVLDVDPEHGGYASLELLAETVGVGPWCGATRVHRTGSGGLHLIYAIGADGWMPPTSARKLGPGLDVRAAGGQVVLPPSWSGKGAYVVEVADGQWPMPAPDVLRGEIERRLVAAPRPERAVGDASPEFQAGVSEGGNRYARSVLERVIAELRDEPVGSRNDKAYAVACRVWEILNAPWNGYGEPDVWDAWMAAGCITGAPAVELHGVWSRAYGRVDGGWTALPASSIPAAEDVPFAGSPVAPVPVLEMTAQEYRAAHPEVDAPADPVAAMLAKRLTRTQFGAMKRPTYLIEDTINLASDTWLIGASGGYKSFVALDWACHVATGEAWHGKRVRQGAVMMVVAEGASGMDQRVAAWERLNGVTVGDKLTMLPMSVYATSGARGTFAERVSEDWRTLCAIVEQEKPALILLDTQARMATGLNEQDNSDMAFWTECVASLRAASGACVLVVHHTGRKGDDARGASAIDAAQDVEWTIKRTDVPGGPRRARLWCSKNKDAADGTSYDLAFEVIELGEDEEGKPITSLGVRLVDVEARPPSSAVAGGGILHEAEPVRMSDRDVRALLMYRVALETVPDVGATEAEIKAMFLELPAVSGLNKETLRRAKNRAWNDLASLGLLMRQDGRQRYRVVVLPSQAERGALTPNRPESGWMAPDGWQVVRTVDDSP